MSAKFAEIVFEISPAPSQSETAEPSWICHRCYSKVLHNTRLRLSFCPVHGLGFELVPRQPGPSRAPSDSSGAGKRSRGA